MSIYSRIYLKYTSIIFNFCITNKNKKFISSLISAKIVVEDNLLLLQLPQHSLNGLPMAPLVPVHLLHGRVDELVEPGEPVVVAESDGLVEAGGGQLALAVRLRQVFLHSVKIAAGKP